MGGGRVHRHPLRVYGAFGVFHLAELTRLVTGVLAEIGTDSATFERELIDHLDLGEAAAIAEGTDALDLVELALAEPAATTNSGPHHKPDAHP